MYLELFIYNRNKEQRCSARRCLIRGEIIPVLLGFLTIICAAPLCHCLVIVEPDEAAQSKDSDIENTWSTDSAWIQQILNRLSIL